MMQNQTGPNLQDPRSQLGILSRGQNIYQAGGYSPYTGKAPNMQAAAIAANQNAIPRQAMRPANSQNNVDYQKVAQLWLQANMA